MIARRSGSTNPRKAFFRHPSAVRRLGALAVLVLVPATIGIAAFAVTELPRMGRIAARQELTDLGGSYLGAEGVVLQATLNDCGPAALANLLHAVGIDAPSLDSLATLAGTGPVGTRASGLIRAGAVFGLPMTLEHIAPEQVAATPRPFIAWVNRNHFVTVTDLSPTGTITVIDPRVGRYTISEQDFRSIWSGEAVLLAGQERISRGELRHGLKHHHWRKNASI